MQKSTKKRQNIILVALRRRAAQIALGVLLLGGIPAQASASTFGPTLLVNTESFMIVDEGDGTTDVEMRFGDSLNEIFRFNRTKSRFEVTDDFGVLGILSGSTLRIDGGADIHGALTASGAVRFDQNLTINDDADTNNAVVTFGSESANETLTWLNVVDSFEFSDDLRVTGNLSSSGTLSVETAINTDGNISLNLDQTAADAVLTFGSDGTNETLTFENTADLFRFTDDVSVRGSFSGSTIHADQTLSASGSLSVEGGAILQGTLSGSSTITFTNLKGCDTIDTNANGVLSCGSDNTGAGALTFTNAQGIYVNQSGDTMTGNLIIGNSATLSVSGAVITESNLTINEDQTAADSVLTFGSDGTNETLTFENTADRFTFSDDVTITGQLSASGAVSFDSTTSFNNVNYTWPASAATASGNLLAVNPLSGQLSWTSGAASSGSIVSLKPDYPNATYFGSGASKVGTLSALYSSGSAINYYRWQTTKTTNQEYWIATQIRVPNTFRSWDSAKPIQFSYRGSGGSLNVKLLDTNDAVVPLTGGSGLTGASWQTATITGPNTSGTYTVDDYITFLVKLTASGSGLNNEFADAGFVELNWETKD